MINILRKYVLPFICKALKFFGHFLIPKISLIIFWVVPFLYEFLDTKTALILWVSSLIIFVIESVCIYRKQKYKPEQTKPSDIFMRGFSFVGLYFFLSAFLKNYKFIDFSWHWIIAVTAAFAVPFALCNTWKYLTLKNNDNEDKIKEKKKNLIKYILFYLLVDAFYISLFTKSLVGQFITGGLCMISIFTNLATLVITRKIISKVAMLQDFIAGIALTVYLIYIIPNPSVKNIVLVLVSALYGGLMTLVGVAWTIKDNQKQISDTKRLECMPFLQIEIPQINDKPLFVIELPLTKTEEITETIYKTLYIRNLGNGTASNLIFTWKYKNQNIEIFDYPPINAIMKGDQCCFQLTLDAYDSMEEISTAFFIFKYNDLLGNSYEQKMILTIEEYDIIRCETNPPEFLGKEVYSINNKKDLQQKIK